MNFKESLNAILKKLFLLILQQIMFNWQKSEIS